jgi:hypothetical protein
MAPREKIPLGKFSACKPVRTQCFQALLAFSLVRADLQHFLSNEISKRIQQGPHGFRAEFTCKPTKGEIYAADAYRNRAGH